MHKGINAIFTVELYTGAWYYGKNLVVASQNPQDYGSVAKIHRIGAKEL